MTVFIVGQDAALEKNNAALASLSAAGHEIGNHSFRHEPWFHLYTKAEIETEIRTAEEAIEKATGKAPRRFPRTRDSA
jgi:peptidoglycan/xylan/chitin deacetylase (PgdA/CDA1 family)